MSYKGEFKLYNVGRYDIVDKDYSKNPIIDLEWEGDKLSQDDVHKLLRKIYKSGCLDLPKSANYVGLIKNRICSYKYRPYIYNCNGNRCGYMFTLSGKYEYFSLDRYGSIDEFIRKYGKIMTEDNHIRLKELKDDVKGCSVIVQENGDVYYTEHHKSVWELDYTDINIGGRLTKRKWFWTICESVKLNNAIKLKEIQTLDNCLSDDNYYLSVDDLVKDDDVICGVWGVENKDGKWMLKDE